MCLVAASSGCWEFHRVQPAEGIDASTSDPCDGGAAGRCKPPSAQSDPFEMPRSWCGRDVGPNPGDTLCQAGKLEVHCNNAPPKIPCPTTFREAAELACSYGGDQYLVHCNACGGVSVHVPDELYPVDIHYDAADALMGVTLLDDDPVGPCEQREFVFGRHCSAIDPPERRDLSLPCPWGSSRRSERVRR